MARTQDAACVPLRLVPGDDLRAALERALRASAGDSAFVVSGIGSLAAARLRFAGAAVAADLEGPLEILTLAGSLTRDGAHLHASVADAAGHVYGGHVAPGCVVRTTAEVLLAVLPPGTLRRERDPATGFAELACRPGADAGEA